MDFAEPLLHAEIIISSSMTLSLIFRLPLWTMKTSCSRIEVSILIEVSPLLNFLSSTLAGEVPNRSQIVSTRSGCEEPEKIFTRRMVFVGWWRSNYSLEKGIFKPVDVEGRRGPLFG